jgi:hypothetical protein
MIIKQQQNALLESLIQRFEDPEMFGVSLTDQGVLLTEILESLVAVNKWDWLSRDMIVTTSYGTDLFELEDRYLRYMNSKTITGTSLIRPSKNYSGDLYYADAREPTSGLSEQGFIEIFPDKLWAQMLNDRRIGSFSQFRHFYTTFERAVIVGWALSGDLKSVDIKLTNTEMFGPDTKFRAINDNILLVQGVSSDSLNSMETISNNQKVRDMQIHIWIKEVLYVEDPGLQSASAANLYEVFSQNEVEALLLPFLEDPDPDVRANVLTALGMPAYKVGFVPGAPLPPRGERLEPATIQPDTLRKLLDVLQKETNQHVLDHFVCTLSTQTFEGKLSPYIEEVRQILPALMTKLECEQTKNDCANILEELPLYG